MAAHLETATLWSHARNELNAAELREVTAHLQTCEQCTQALAGIRDSVGLLGLLAEPPPLPNIVAQRVGAKLNEHFDAEDARGLVGWWRGSMRLVGFAFAAVVLLGVVAALLWKPTSSPVVPEVAKQDPPVVPPGPPAPPPELKPAVKQSALIASARKAHNGTASASAKQAVNAGETVSTEKGGNLWMRLPDGSKAGLTGATEVRVAKLEDAAVALEIEKGSLAMVVPHKQERVLTVRAGDLEVKDLGTRFLVSRELGRVLVAVEEGSVEVNVPGSRKTLTAGHALTWSNGELKEANWAVNPPPPPRPAPYAGTPDIPPVGTNPEQPHEANTPPPPPEDQGSPGDEGPKYDTSAEPDDAWAGMPAGQKQAPPPPPGRATTATPARPTYTSSSGFSLELLEQRVQEFGRSVVTLATETTREQHARLIGQLADAGDCAGALNQAARWLAAPRVSEPLETKLRRSVLTNQVRCLTRLGRNHDAQLAAEELRLLPTQ